VLDKIEKMVWGKEENGGWEGRHRRNRDFPSFINNPHKKEDPG
jgi:hypothetical protein